MIMDAEIPFGQRVSDARIVTASETPRGISCNCICPHCGKTLQAHQGDKIAWHFQHTVSSDGCSYGFETGLHKFAKQVVAEQGGVFFPPLIADFNGTTETIKLGRWVKLRSVALEQRIASGGGFIVPDIVVETRELKRSADGLGITDRTVFIEIFVNHETQEAKRQFLANNNIAAFEIDLSFLRARHDTTVYSCTADILRDARRYWLWHPDLKAANDALETKLRSRHQLQNKLKSQRWRFSLRNAEQQAYRRELISRRDAILLQKQQEVELSEYRFNAARDIELKRRERERWLKECEKFMEEWQTKRMLENMPGLTS